MDVVYGSPFFPIPSIVNFVGRLGSLFCCSPCFKGDITIIFLAPHQSETFPPGQAHRNATNTSSQGHFGSRCIVQAMPIEPIPHLGRVYLSEDVYGRVLVVDTDTCERHVLGVVADGWALQYDDEGHGLVGLPGQASEWLELRMAHTLCTKGNGDGTDVARRDENDEYDNYVPLSTWLASKQLDTFPFRWDEPPHRAFTLSAVCWAHSQSGARVWWCTDDVYKEIGFRLSKALKADGLVKAGRTGCEYARRWGCQNRMAACKCNVAASVLSL